MKLFKDDDLLIYKLSTIVGAFVGFLVAVLTILVSSEEELLEENNSEQLS